MRLHTLCALLAILTTQSPALCQADSSREIVRKYLEARNATMQLDATPQDIEKTLDFCAEDLVYEHPAAKAKIEGKKEIRTEMASYLGLTKNASYKVTTHASNRDVVVATVSWTFLSKRDDGGWKKGARSNITVFEVEKGKIKRILDY